MEVRVIWASGSVTAFSTPVCTSENGREVAIEVAELDLSDPQTRGVTLRRYRFPFGKADMYRFEGEEDDRAHAKMIVEPDEVASLVQLSVDGVPWLERDVFEVDEGGKVHRIMSPDGKLFNLVLPPTGEDAGPELEVDGRDAGERDD